MLQFGNIFFWITICKVYLLTFQQCWRQFIYTKKAFPWCFVFLIVIINEIQKLINRKHANLNSGLNFHQKAKKQKNNFCSEFAGNFKLSKIQLVLGCPISFFVGTIFAVSDPIEVKPISSTFSRYFAINIEKMAFFKNSPSQNGLTLRILFHLKNVCM